MSIQLEEAIKLKQKRKRANTMDVNETEPPNLDGDRLNLLMLTLMNVLQGLPIGILMTMPFFLQKRGASYEAQAQLSLCRWPMAFKLLWAPIIDGFYSVRFGRRKSWIVPIQLLVGTTLVSFSYFIEDLLGSKEQPTNMTILFPIFFLLAIAVNMQDVAMDAWAITMLKKRNIGYAPIATSFGQSIAMALGNVSLLTLESAEFCNTWLRWTPQPKGIITLSGLIYRFKCFFVRLKQYLFCFKASCGSGAS